MAQDKNKQPLQVGDCVTIACKVTAVADDNRLDVLLETVEGAGPAETPTAIWLNGKQVVKQDSPAMKGTDERTETTGSVGNRRSGPQSSKP
jgi:hypothetical protein